MAVSADQNPEWVFLNIPYDREFEPLYLAYIAGLGRLGLTPKIASAIPGGKRRLGRILDLVRSCRYSVHDLSRIEVDRATPVTPRFNMPFELGLAVAWAELSPAEHIWFVFESQEHRIQKSLSDLNGTDIQVHEGSVSGVMRELCRGLHYFDWASARSNSPGSRGRAPLMFFDPVAVTRTTSSMRTPRFSSGM